MFESTSDNPSKFRTRNWVEIKDESRGNYDVVTYFDSFGVEHIPKEIKTFIKNKNIKTNIFRIQAHDSIMCGFFCIAFINFMLKGKRLTEYRSFFT